MKLKYIIKNLIIIFLIIFISGCTPFSNIVENKNSLNTSFNETDETFNDLKVHYLDVDQGDSIFIELPNNQTMLIDAGEANKYEKIANYIKTLNYDTINYLVGTHPHSDHIGGLKEIINNFTIENIYMPKVVATSKTYENLLTTILNKNLKVKTAKTGIEIINENNLYIDILSPINDSYSDLNNYSVVIRLNYGENKFLFMGDAEKLIEDEISNKFKDLKVDVLKVGHHGSDTSSSNEFINFINPKYAIISVGAKNKYNHPSKSTIDMFINKNIDVYRTDKNGTITVTSNGNEINIKSEK